ncbi:unnamed protein product [Meganyctiphanes norvegica]|uniref:Kazal-like domain-containing protein n=1 Tax=Meganyctiphanes norvegica TaxID=48144 RepID=A0AAV2R8K5_MEGNR
MFHLVILSLVFGPLLVMGRIIHDIEIIPSGNQNFRPGSPDGKNDCDLLCPTTEDFHCGTDSVTYKNPCELLNANCKNFDIKLAYRGPCDSTKPIPPTSCPKTWSCLGWYQPVCGTNDKTYDNNCYLVIANCRDTSIGYKSAGPCKKNDTTPCKTYCNHLPSQPICGSDLRVHRNQCELKNAKCDNPNLIQAKCPAPVVVECAGVCPMDYQPMCGSDGKSYINKCHMDLTTCKTPSITLAYEGPCKTPVIDGCTACTGNEHEDFVCGSDAVSYRSACAFNYALCKQKCPATLKLEHTGHCTCDESCHFASYDPICGSDGVTYETACEFRVASCKTPEIKVQGTGQCS